MRLGIIKLFKHVVKKRHVQQKKWIRLVTLQPKCLGKEIYGKEFYRNDGE